VALTINVDAVNQHPPVKSANQASLLTTTASRFTSNSQTHLTDQSPLEIAVENPSGGDLDIGPTKTIPDVCPGSTQGEDEDSRFTVLTIWDTRSNPAGAGAKGHGDSNGELIETITDGDNKIYHQNKFILPTWMTLAVVLQKFRDDWQGIPVIYYCRKKAEESMPGDYGQKTPRMIAFFW